jgi:hypothetical protein
MRTQPCMRPGCKNTRSVPEWYSGAPTYCLEPECARSDAARIGKINKRFNQATAAVRRVPKRVLEAMRDLRNMRLEVEPGQSVRFNPATGLMEVAPKANRVSHWDHFERTDAEVDNLAFHYHIPMNDIKDHESRYNVVRGFASKSKTDVREHITGQLLQAMRRDIECDSEKTDALLYFETVRGRNVRR